MIFNCFNMNLLIFLLYLGKSAGKYCIIPNYARVIYCPEGFTEYFFNSSMIFDLKPENNELIIEATSCFGLNPYLNNQNWDNLNVTITSKYVATFIGINQSLSCNSLTLQNVTLLTSEDTTITTTFLSTYLSSLSTNASKLYVRKNGKAVLEQSNGMLRYLALIDDDSLFDITVIVKFQQVCIVEQGFRIISANSTGACSLNFKSLTLISDDRELLITNNCREGVTPQLYPHIEVTNYCEVSFDNSWQRTIDHIEDITVYSHFHNSVVLIPNDFGVPNMTFTNFDLIDAMKGIYCVFPNNGKDYSQICPKNTIPMKFTNETFYSEFSAGNGSILMYLFDTSMERHPIIHPNAIRGKLWLIAENGRSDSHQYVETSESDLYFPYVNMRNVTLIPSSLSKIGVCFLSKFSYFYPTGYLIVINMTCFMSSLMQYESNPRTKAESINLNVDLPIESVHFGEQLTKFKYQGKDVMITASLINISFTEEITFTVYSTAQKSYYSFYTVNLFEDVTMYIDNSCYNCVWNRIKPFSIVTYSNSKLTVISYQLIRPGFLIDVESDSLDVKLLGMTPIETPIPTPIPTKENEVIEFISQPYFYMSAIIFVLLVIIISLLIWLLITKRKRDRLILQEDSGIMVISLIDNV